jgi:hypothetical protein
MRAFPLLLVLLAACTLERTPAPTTLAFGAPTSLSAATGVGATPTFAVSPAGLTTVAWVSAPDGGTDGRLYTRVDSSAAPSELRDSLGPIEPHGEAPPKLTYGPDGALYALYSVARLVPGRRFPATALRLALSRDGGRSWGAPLTVGDSADDGTPFASRNFHALHVGADGALYVSWLASDGGRSATFVTRSVDGGRRWSTPVHVGGEACPCCRTALATARDGTLFVAWREVFAGNVREVVVARSADHGATWSAPVPVQTDGWVYDGCPHAGPSLAVDSSGALHVVFWTGKEGAAGVFHARSTDGGRTFTRPVALGAARFSQPAHAQIVAAPGGRLIAAWDDGTLRSPRIVVRVSADGGRTFGAPQAVSDSGRAASFPVLAAAPGGVTVAWSDQSAAAGDHAAHAHPAAHDMTPMPLSSVGESNVFVRRAALR